MNVLSDQEIDGFTVIFALLALTGFGKEDDDDAPSEDQESDNNCC